MKIKVMRENGEELLIDTTRDAVAILMSDHERQNLADVAKIQNTMLQVPYRRMNLPNAGAHDISWWQIWATSNWGDHLEGGKSEARPFIDRMGAAEAGA
jgi:hypothetical protein